MAICIYARQNLAMATTLCLQKSHLSRRWSHRRGSLLACVKGAGNRNMRECSALLAQLSLPNTGGASQAPRNLLTGARTRFMAS